jgi:hypothetical protein
VVISDLSNNRIAENFCLFSVSTYGFWGGRLSLPLKVSLSYDVAELIKGRVSLAKHARLSTRNPMGRYRKLWEKTFAWGGAQQT